MVGLSFEHFIDERTIRDQEKTAKRIGRNMLTVFKKDTCAIFYINGCSYYVKPLNEVTYGFGGEDKEIEFDRTDTESGLFEKLLGYFKKHSSECIAYSGYDMKIEKYCKW